MSIAQPATSMNPAQNSKCSLGHHLLATDVTTVNLAATVATALPVFEGGVTQAGREISVYKTVSSGYSKGSVLLTKRIRTDAQGIVAKAHYPFTK